MPLDFTELRVRNNDGQRFQQLIRALARELGLDPLYNGIGPDDGVDLMFRDEFQTHLCNYEIRWLVQCKDNSLNGRSVSEDDVGCVLDKLLQHSCTGYLLACTTNVTAGLTKMLNALGRQERVPVYTAVWDGAHIEGLLLQPNNDSLFRQFLPEGYRLLQQDQGNNG